MKLVSLIAQWRADVDDAQQPFLWSEASVLNWFNEAEQEACRRAELIVDSSTAEICTLQVTANNPWVAYDPRIVRVLRARPVGHVGIGVLTMAEMDERPNWEDETGTVLKALVTDMETGKFRCWPTLTANTTIAITASRLPLADMDDSVNAEPEIRAEYHLKLLDWVKWRAYSVDDVDGTDPAKARAALKRFEAEFGTASALLDAWLRRYGNREFVGGSFA
ncbi:MAG: hypothetical protein HY749_16330 [Gammaproteobacteria bacterium]|nr:hypothetical protein [Gammaproteobacteria bacterium]